MSTINSMMKINTSSIQFGAIFDDDFQRNREKKEENNQAPFRKWWAQFIDIYEFCLWKCHNDFRVSTLTAKNEF